jgi:hypothetical protein
VRLAFVLQLVDESEPVRGRLIGRIEEVDTGRELRFRSTEELFEFLSKCLDERRASNRPSKREVDDL